MSEDIVNRLRGKYPVGPIVNGEPEFGWRKFDGLPPIQAEAADEIELLRALVGEMREALSQISSTVYVAARVINKADAMLEARKKHRAMSLEMKYFVLKRN